MLDALGDSSVTARDLPEPGDYPSFHPFIRGVFSQWHATAFELEGLRFSTAEQWMMYAKAVLFEDRARADAILSTSDPAAQKRHGQLVRGFDDDIWDRWKVQIVHCGNRAKFEQNPGALRQLLGTAPSMLVEANPRDWIWGAGLAIDDPRAHRPEDWRGQNLLGRVLTKLREELS